MKKQTTVEWDWVLDVTFDPPCFCPYNRKTGDIMIGMNYFANKCPGELVGVLHIDGQDAAEEWVEKNPRWYEKYK